MECYLDFSCRIWSRVCCQKTRKLQRDRILQIKKIQQIERIIAQTSSKKKHTLEKLYAVNEQIKAQESLVYTIKEELTRLNTHIQHQEWGITKQKKKLKLLKKEYAEMIYKAYISNRNMSDMLFLFSSESFYQLLMRIKYLNQYAAYRRKQSLKIEETTQTLKESLSEDQIEQKEKQKLLQKEIQQINKLTSLQKTQQDIIHILKRKEKSLKKDIEQSKRALLELEKLITQTFTREKSTITGVGTHSLQEVSKRFYAHRKKMNWPVKGFISVPFGLSTHPVFKRVKINNKGVNIRTSKNQAVQSVFEGVVKAIILAPPPLGLTIMLGHGQYYTLYAGVKNIQVKKGEVVQEGQTIAKIDTNIKGVSELNFQIRKHSKALNPMLWLKKK